MTAHQMIVEASKVAEPVTEEEKADLIAQYGETLGHAWIKTLASLRLRSAVEELYGW